MNTRFLIIIFVVLNACGVDTKQSAVVVDALAMSGQLEIASPTLFSTFDGAQFPTDEQLDNITNFAPDADYHRTRAQLYYDLPGTFLTSEEFDALRRSQYEKFINAGYYRAQVNNYDFTLRAIRNTNESPLAIDFALNFGQVKGQTGRLRLAQSPGETAVLGEFIFLIGAHKDDFSLGLPNQSAVNKIDFSNLGPSSFYSKLALESTDEKVRVESVSRTGDTDAASVYSRFFSYERNGNGLFYGIDASEPGATTRKYTVVMNDSYALIFESFNPQLQCYHLKSFQEKIEQQAVYHARDTVFEGKRVFAGESVRSDHAEMNINYVFDEKDRSSDSVNTGDYIITIDRYGKVHNGVFDLKDGTFIGEQQQFVIKSIKRALMPDLVDPGLCTNSGLIIPEDLPSIALNVNPEEFLRSSQVPVVEHVSVSVAD